MKIIGKSMPIYEFSCKKCNHEFEKLVFRGDENYVHCPECNYDDVTRLMSASSLRSSSGIGACMPGNPGNFS